MSKTFLTVLFVAILATALSLSGCLNRSNNNNVSSAPEPAVSEPAVETPNSEPAAEEPAPEAETETPAIADSRQRLGSAEKDSYDGIEIDAFIRERNAILPGFAIPITVTVKNTGDQTVDYVHGSGSYETPESVFIAVDGLQPILPKDHLGPVTMDYQVSELKPGDQIEFELYVLAAEPDAMFDSSTIDLYGRDERYIGDFDWPALQQEFPALVAAEPGTYEAQAYFLYSVRGESGVPNLTEAPTGYAEHSFAITIG